MKVKGIKRGQSIELLEELNIPDGVEITVEVAMTGSLSEPERLTRLNQIFGAWKNQPALDETFAEIDSDRHTYKGRAIESIDD